MFSYVITLLTWNAYIIFQEYLWSVGQHFRFHSFNDNYEKEKRSNAYCQSSTSSNTKSTSSSSQPMLIQSDWAYNAWPVSYENTFMNIKNSFEGIQLTLKYRHCIFERPHRSRSVLVVDYWERVQATQILWFTNHCMTRYFRHALFRGIVSSVIWFRYVNGKIHSKMLEIILPSSSLKVVFL